MHRQLIEGFKRLQSRVDEARRMTAGMGDDRGTLGDDRSTALLDLAKHYLPELSAESIDATWSEVRGELSQVLMRLQDELRRSQTELAKYNDRRSIEEDRLLKLDNELDSLTEKRDRLASDVQQRLSEDQEFVALTSQAAAAETALERAEANFNEIEQDAARKLPSFQSSTFFNYLYDRKFGSKQYAARGFTRRMDRWLANYIDYSKAKKSYDFLVKTPEQMRQIIAEDRKALDVVMESLEQRHEAVVRECGLQAVIDSVQRLRDDRQSRLNELELICSKVESLETQIADLENPRGDYYRQAIEAFRHVLESIETADLDARAVATEELTDDQIVARIRGIDESLERLDEQQERSREQQRQLQRCLDAYGRMMQRFRAAKFDSNRSYFVDSFDLLALIDRAGQEADIDELWSAMKTAQFSGAATANQVAMLAANPMATLMTGAMMNVAGALNEQAIEAARRAASRRQHGYGNPHRDDFPGRRRSH